MAYQPDPNDPIRSGLTDAETNRQARRNNLDNELRADPELNEPSGNGGKIAMMALAGALLLGAVFYGLNNSNMNQAGTTPSGQTAQTTPASPPGVRDVTPRINSEPGTTTGAAPSRPSTPAAPTSTNNTASPPADSAPAAK